MTDQPESSIDPLCTNDSLANLDTLDYDREFRKSYEYYNGLLMGALRRRYGDLPEGVYSWIKRVNDYNIPGGKLNRGIAVWEVVQELIRDRNLDHPTRLQLLKDSQCLGWCIEWLQAFFLVADDIMDGSEQRRGQLCWYRKDGIGLRAVNDALLIRSSVGVLLKETFANRKNVALYYSIKELFESVELETELGQLMDLTEGVKDGHSGDFRNDLESVYSAIVKYKTSLYTFYLPFASAYLLLTSDNHNLNHDHNLSSEKEILLSIGYLFQMQDDFLDVFGDPKITGKIGTDIQEGKCTWPLVRLLGKPDFIKSDRNLLLENYGRNDLDSVGCVKRLYEQYGLSRDYEEVQADLSSKITKKLGNLSVQSNARAITKFLNRIIRRIK